MSSDPAQARYAAHAAMLAERYEAMSAADHLAPVIDLFPNARARVADIGAGSGRDAAWLAARGHDVTAVEPVAALRAEAMRRHRGASIRWIEDGLPDLTGLLASDRRSYDLVTLSAVWHHLPPADRGKAMSALGQLLRPSGVLLLSLRQGPAAPEQGVHPADPEPTVALARAVGLQLLRQVPTAEQPGASGAEGIDWIWLVFRGSGG